MDVDILKARQYEPAAEIHDPCVLPGVRTGAGAVADVHDALALDGDGFSPALRGIDGVHAGVGQHEVRGGAADRGFGFCRALRAGGQQEQQDDSQVAHTISPASMRRGADSSKRAAML